MIINNQCILISDILNMHHAGTYLLHNSYWCLDSVNIVIQIKHHLSLGMNLLIS